MTSANPLYGTETRENGVPGVMGRVGGHGGGVSRKITRDPAHSRENPPPDRGVGGVRYGARLQDLPHAEIPNGE